MTLLQQVREFLSLACFVAPAAIVLFWVGICLSGVGIRRLPNGDGIIPGPGGSAVYLQGEACTVNYTEDRDAFERRLAWCLEQYDFEQAERSKAIAEEKIQ